VSAKFFEEPARKTPVFEEADVVVAGGGAAGVAAAISAAKNGAKVILIENTPVLGGTILAGAAALNSFTNHVRLHPKGERHQIIRGVGQVLVDYMVEAGGCPGYKKGLSIGDHEAPRQVIFLPEVWKYTSFKIMKDFGVKLLMRTMLVGAIAEKGKILGAIVENKTGRGVVVGKQFIDASGDADLAFHAGADCIKEMEQAHIKETTLLFSLNDVDVNKVLEYCKKYGAERSKPVIINDDDPLNRVVSFGINLQEVPEIGARAKEMGIRMLHLISYRDEIFYVNANRVKPHSKGVLNYEEGFEVEMKLRDQIEEIVSMIKKHIDGFQKSYVNNTTNFFGVRRTRTVRCEYDITIDDIKEERGFPDEIGRNGYQDLPWPGYQPKNGGSYGIPYRAILPTRMDNLLVAGRLITSEWTAHMSTRNTGPCMVQGQAAGTAAALSVKQGVRPRDLDVHLLQETLLKDGVYLEKHSAVKNTAGAALVK
jgi:hypothetical protein